MQLEISPEMHIAPDTEVKTVLLFDGTHVGIVAFITQLSTEIARTVASHAWSVIMVSHNGESLQGSTMSLGPYSRPRRQTRVLPEMLIRCKEPEGLCPVQIQ
jgi:bifunctional N-acetylglucosamine-1-phosphate-uridyltransferase/glucosamine-1-phosphate-acetyltransferase GlmU-like protein